MKTGLKFCVAQIAQVLRTLAGQLEEATKLLGGL
jgi:hypothetical protein